MKISSAILAGLLVAAAASGCSSSGSSKPARSTGNDTSSSNPCAALAGKPVGAETNPSDPNTSKLANPPKACDAAAEVSNSGGCYTAAGKSIGLWFYYTLDGTTITGRAGGTWHATSGDFDQAADLKPIGC